MSRTEGEIFLGDISQMDVIVPKDTIEQIILKWINDMVKKGIITVTPGLRIHTGTLSDNIIRKIKAENPFLDFWE